LSERIIRPMYVADYECARKLWEKTEGIGLREADSRAKIADLLSRNAGLSYVCEQRERIIGTILCGYDGRRGYIYHLAVDEENRLKGIGKNLVEVCLKELKKKGGDKCHLFVFNDNETGKKFWSKLGWTNREDIMVYSRSI